jgi:hypothetical protein
MRAILFALLLLGCAALASAVEVVRGVVRETSEISCGTGCGSYSLEPDPGYQFTMLKGDFRLLFGQHVQVTGYLDNCSGCLVLVPTEAVLVLPPTTGVDGEEGGVPSALRLSQNYPNPFNPSTVIAYELPAPGRVRLTVANILGQDVALLTDEEKSPGVHRTEWSPGGLPSGVYFSRLEVSYGTLRRVLTRAMLYLR